MHVAASLLPHLLRMLPYSVNLTDAVVGIFHTVNLTLTCSSWLLVRTVDFPCTESIV